MQLEAIASRPIASYLGEETNTRLIRKVHSGNRSEPLPGF